MGLLFRIIQRLYLIVSKIIKNSLIDDPYYEHNVLLVWLANFFIVMAIVSGFGIVLYMFVWAISLGIFVKALILAYFEALVWSKFCNRFTSFGQEMYLIGSTVGYTVLIGTAIQLHRMPWADGNTLLFYWIFLLILGFIAWGITLFNVSRAAEVKPVLAIKKVTYKQRFRSTKLPQEIPANNQVQAYLKKLKWNRLLMRAPTTFPLLKLQEDEYFIKWILTYVGLPFLYVQAPEIF